jgi:hypothetical protein
MILYLLMAVTGAAMVLALRRHRRRGEAWCRPLAGVAALATLGLALTSLLAPWLHSPHADYAKWAMQWEQVQCHYLGAHLASLAQGQRLLVLHEAPTEYNRERIAAALQAFREGLGGRAEIVADYPVAAPPETAMPEAPPLPELADAKAFDAAIAAHPDCTWVVSLIGLPLDFKEMALWRQKAALRPRVALLNAPLYELRRAIEAGAVAAVVTYRPDAPFAPGPPAEQVDVAFNSRFLLATRDNITELAQRYHELFPAP